MNEEKINCKHNYEPIIRKVQQWKKQYTKDCRYDYAVLTQEEIYLYCIKCWDYKNIIKVEKEDKE